MNLWLAVFFGGGLGSLARYATGNFFNNAAIFSFPYGTLMANSLSSFILGIVIGLMNEKFSNNNFLFLFLAVGFCGGFSTFSTFSAETFNFLKNGMYLMATLNIAFNLILTITLLGAGMLCSKLF